MSLPSDNVKVNTLIHKHGGYVVVIVGQLTDFYLVMFLFLMLLLRITNNQRMISLLHMMQ